MIAFNSFALTPVEYRAILQVAQRHELTPTETALLLAIRRCEAGRAGLEFGVAQDNPGHPARQYAHAPMMSLTVQASYAARIIKRKYNGDLHRLAKTYCPYNAEVWARNVKFWWRIYY